jgi:hypothetical protein
MDNYISSINIDFKFDTNHKCLRFVFILIHIIGISPIDAINIAMILGYELVDVFISMPLFELQSFIPVFHLPFINLNEIILNTNINKLISIAIDDQNLIYNMAKKNNMSPTVYKIFNNIYYILHIKNNIYYNLLKINSIDICKKIPQTLKSIYINPPAIYSPIIYKFINTNLPEFDNLYMFRYL